MQRRCEGKGDKNVNFVSASLIMQNGFKVSFTNMFACTRKRTKFKMKMRWLRIENALNGLLIFKQYVSLQWIILSPIDRNYVKIIIETKYELSQQNSGDTQSIMFKSYVSVNEFLVKLIIFNTIQ